MSATASLTPDSDRILEMLRHELGPELLGLLTDPKITNIHANEDGSVFVRTTAGTEVDVRFRLASGDHAGAEQLGRGRTHQAGRSQPSRRGPLRVWG